MLLHVKFNCIILVILVFVRKEKLVIQLVFLLVSLSSILKEVAYKIYTMNKPKKEGKENKKKFPPKRG